MHSLHVRSGVCSPFPLIIVFSAAFIAAATSTQAQNTASCSFAFFPTLLTSPSAQLFPFGVNDFGTVVGSASKTRNTAFIRWANGSFNFPAGTSALTSRNDNGVSLGYDTNGNGILLSGSGNIRSAAVRIGSTKYDGPGVSFVGINNWDSVVGRYGDLAGIAHGFKRWSNGNGFILDFPAKFKSVNAGTFPTSINDSGVIVGFTQLPYHAFIYDNGKWATLKYPNAIATWLYGISNAGVMVGNAELSNGSNRGFLYEQGTFKDVIPPNTIGPGVGSGIIGISLRTGLILGFADLHNSPRQGYIAKCD